MAQLNKAEGVFAPERYVSLFGKCTQAGTDPPVMTIVENQFGEVPTWGYTSPGFYTLTFSAAVLTAGKTFARIEHSGAAGVHTAIYTSTTVLTVKFFDVATPTAAESGAFDFRVKVYI